MDNMDDADGNITLQIPTTESLIEVSRSTHLDASSTSSQNAIARSKSSVQFEPKVTINVDVENSESSQHGTEAPPNFLTSSSSVQGHQLPNSLKRDGESLSAPTEARVSVTQTQTQIHTAEEQTSSPSSSSSSSNSPSPSKTPIPPSPTTSVPGETPQHGTVAGRKGAGVKLEPPDDMKDYVETTMNELLGWYGLPSVDNMDVGSRHAMASLATRNSPNNPTAPPPTETPAPSTKRNGAPGNDSAKDLLSSNRGSRMITPTTVINQGRKKDKDCDILSPTGLVETTSTAAVETKASNDSNNNSNGPRDTHNNDAPVSLTEAMTANTFIVPGRDTTHHDGTDRFYGGESSGGDNAAMVIRPIIATEDDVDDCENNYSRGYNDVDSDDVNDDGCDRADNNQSLCRHERDSNSAASDSSSSSNAAVTVLESDTSGGDRCSWCQKTGNKQLTLETPTGIKVFCSELCFTQCRRASFKKNKVCDWCKHVRHTVNFVDFQDGDTQLQFCSEKCLNQYKMNIFCKEAQEHLQHFQDLEDVVTEPIRHEEKNERNNQKEILITPELWLAGNSQAGKGQSNPVDYVKQEVDDNSCQEDENPNNNRSRNNGVYVKNGIYSLSGRNDNDADNDDINDDEDFKDDDDSEPGEIETTRRLRGNSRFEDHLGSTDDEINHAREKSLRKSPSLPDHLKSLKTSKGAESKQKERDGSTGRQILTERDNIHPRTHGNKPESFPSPGKSRDDPNNEAFAKKTTDYLLQQWAASRLMSLVPEHMRGDVTGAAATGAIAGMGQPLSHLPYGANPLLYSNLFRLPPPHTSPSTSHNAVTGESTNRAGDFKVKSRHESRRELLRDRDLFHARNKKSKSVNERGRPETSSVPLSPSTSHSSAGTPGPSHLSEPDPLAAHLSAFGRSFPHSLLMPNSSHTSTSATPEYLQDPAHASAFFQLQLALQQSAERHNLLFPDAATAPQPTLRSSKIRHNNESRRVGEASTSQRHTPSVPSSTPYHQQSQTPHNTPQSSEHQPNTPPLFQLSQGVPPVTVLVPYPVAIPIPLPFPFPIPITPEKFYSSLAKNSESNESSSSGAHSRENGDNSDHNVFTPSNNADGNVSNNSNHFIKHSPASSPSPFNNFQPDLNLPGSSFSPPGTTPGEDESVMSLRREGIIPFIKSPGLSTSSKRSISETMTPYMFDLSKKPRLSISSSSNDEEAMDLSKQSGSSASPKNMTDLSEKENDALMSRYTPTGSAGNPSPENLVVPKIHIVSDKTAPPLSTPPLASHLPPPLEQSTYSSRRSRILDAPSVPRVSRMPSPERRYVRNVPKDMVEAAKRRGLRARIKTK